MPTSSLLFDITVIFLTALVGGMVAELLKQSPIIGYIVGGIIAGPYATGLVKNVSSVQDFAEIGVILLMFTLGIEFSISRLASVKRIAILGGIIQIALQIGITTLLNHFMGVTIFQAFFIGCVISISSTMIVMRVLSDQGQLNSTHGQIMLGMLVVQDLAVVVMVSVLPRLGDLTTREIPSLIATIAISLGFVLITTFLAQKVVPPIMERAARGNNADIFLILALSLGLGTALLAESLGTSLSLGAFLAGLLVSDSDYTHELLGKVISLKDAFIILFFVSVGMMIDPHHLFSDLHLLVILLFLILPIKFLLFFFVTRAFHYHSRVAFYVGLGMMQTGEFSFVMAKMGLDNGIISASVYNVILASSLITILTTPVFIKAAPAWYEVLQQNRLLKSVLGKPEGAVEAAEAMLNDHVILCGYGRVGQQVGMALQELNIPYVVLEYDYNLILRLKNENIAYIYGDATADPVIRQALPENARLAVLALPYAPLNERVARKLLNLNPKLKIISRAHTHWGKQLLFEAGAFVVVEPEEEAGLQMVRHLILHLDLPKEVIVDYLESHYIKGYHSIIRQQAIGQSSNEPLTVRSFEVGEESCLINVTLHQSGIRENTGCTIVTIRRANGEVIINPHSTETIKSQDTLVAMGTPTQLLAFAHYNQGGQRQNG